MKLFLTSAFALLSCAAIAQGELRIYNWSGYTSEEMIAAFEEETGVNVDVREPLGDVSYVYRRGGRRIHKTVHFYLCDFVSGSTDDHDHEVDDARWMPLEEARNALSYPGERELIERALSKLASGR